MKEREYIDATNLAKLRIASAVLREVLPITQKEEDALHNCRVAIREMELRIEKRVRK